MAYDFALSKDGDWIFSANGDVQGVSGELLVEQRVKTRLRIVQGWALDPTNGLLGSRLKSGLRLPKGRALRELPLMVREALAPMTDIRIQDVTTEEVSSDSRAVLLKIIYVAIDEDRGDVIEQQAQETITIELEA